MAEAHKFETLDKAVSVFPHLTWAQDGDGNTYVDNSKTGERVAVSKGQYIVKIADRYEVHDEAPEKAKTAEPKEAKAAEAPAEPAPVDPGAGQPAGTEQSNPQVAPEAIGAPADSPEAQAAPAESVDGSATE